jgi:hypothetical protein
MSHTFTRQELFDLVWSAPTRAVAKQLGISDVGLAKACRRPILPFPHFPRHSMTLQGVYVGRSAWSVAPATFRAPTHASSSCLRDYRKHY